MSRTKERLESKQKEREEKLLERIKTGKAVRVTYEERKRKKAQPNAKCPCKSVQEEIAQRQDRVEKATVLYRQMLPDLLKKLSRIKDPRNPLKVKHKLAVLMTYGILMFVFHIGSRRDANKEMSTPIFWENVKAVFPELSSMPHADTLARLLERIQVEQIQDCLIELLHDLMRKKKFKNYMINKRYLIAVDGTQKLTRNYQWQKEALERHVGAEECIPQYYVYVLESVLVLDNGFVLPVLTEILDNSDWEKGKTKQDCESKAFKRLAQKLCKVFGKGNVTLIADGLYACGPVISKCQEYQWDYMIVLKEAALQDVWDDAMGIMTLQSEDSLRTYWGDRQQDYMWANGVEYAYGYQLRYKAMLNVVICYETWTENHIRSTGKIEEKQTRYAWISSRLITSKNVFMRCTKMARYRWQIENHFLIEKHQGYSYEHCYSYNWQAMKGFHYLMKIGHFMNTLVMKSEIIIEYVENDGIQGFISKFKLALTGSPLDICQISVLHHTKLLWKLRAS